MAEITLPSAFALAQATKPRLDVEEARLSSKWNPGKVSAFRYGATWVGTGVVRPFGKGQADKANEVEAVLQSLQLADNFCELPLHLQTYDTAKAGSLAIDATRTATQSDGRIKIAFSTLTVAQRNAKLPIGTWLRWDSRNFLVVGHESASADIYVIGSYIPSPVTATLARTETMRCRIGLVSTPEKDGIIGLYTFNYSEYVA